MVNATIDNNNICVLLGDNETYTPANNSVQKVNILVGRAERLKIMQGGNTETLVDKRAGGENNSFATEMVIDDTITIMEPAKGSTQGIYISGFEVN